MGGIKNNLQRYGNPMNQDFSKITDPFERDFAFRSTQATAYCRHCGGWILPAASDKDNRHVNSEKELQMRAHTACQEAFVEEQRLKALEEERRREQAAKSFDWDSYMEEMMKRGEKE